MQWVVRITEGSGGIGGGGSVFSGINISLPCRYEQSLPNLHLPVLWNLLQVQGWRHPHPFDWKSHKMLGQFCMSWFALQEPLMRPEQCPRLYHSQGALGLVDIITSSSLSLFPLILVFSTLLNLKCASPQVMIPCDCE